MAWLQAFEASVRALVLAVRQPKHVSPCQASHAYHSRLAPASLPPHSRLPPASLPPQALASDLYLRMQPALSRLPPGLLAGGVEAVGALLGPSGAKPLWVQAMALAVEGASPR